ncbi:hypothetical protein C8J57DRAFT_1220966 [Mycena rebaudengoi]|nr:hypothetical protein C8J57DRAFT_1220966 [Mycena rebaudengoi]
MQSASRGLEKPKILAKAAARGGKVVGRYRTNSGNTKNRSKIWRVKNKRRYASLARTEKMAAGAAAHGGKLVRRSTSGAARRQRIGERRGWPRGASKHLKIIPRPRRASERRGAKSAGSWYAKDARASARWGVFQRSRGRAIVTAGTRKSKEKKVRGQRNASVGTAKSACRASRAAVRWREGERPIKKLGGGAASRARVDGKSRTQKMQKRVARTDGGSCKRVNGAARRRRTRDAERDCGNAEKRMKYARAAQHGGAMAGRGALRRRRVGVRGTMLIEVGARGWEDRIGGTPERKCGWSDRRDTEKNELKSAQNDGGNRENSIKKSGGGAWGREDHRAGCAERRRDHEKSKKRGKGGAACRRRVEMERPAC